MTRLFCPDYGALPFGNGYLPMFTLYRDEPLKVITYPKGERRVFSTWIEARRAAKNWVAEHLNTIRAEDIQAPAPAAIAGEVQQFLARRDQEDTELKTKVFGEDTCRTVRRPGKRPFEVVIEKRRRRA